MPIIHSFILQWCELAKYLSSGDSVLYPQWLTTIARTDGLQIARGLTLRPFVSSYPPLQNMCCFKLY